VHRYTVELRIVGEHLDSENVTRTLGIKPTRVARRGHAKIPGSTARWNANMWGFELLPPGKDDWASLEEALQALLGIVGPLRDRLQAYSADNEICLWCGHFTSSFDGGPTLSPQLLKALADFGVELTLDTYRQ
jgi:hypothetical protein